MDTLAIIKRIEVRLSELGMSKADFYRLSGISSASYSQWNTGLYKPSDKKLQSAADCLGVTFEYLRYGTETTNENTFPAESSKSNDVLDEVDVAFYNQFRELDENEKDLIRDMVSTMRERRAKKQEK